MIGTQKTGTIPGVTLSVIGHKGIVAEVDGKPARLAVITEDGRIIAAGPDVAREAEAVSVNWYQAMLKAKGHMRVISQPLAVTGAPQ